MFRFQNRRMKWRNTKERELLMSNKSTSNTDLSNDCQVKEEFIRPYSPSSIENNNERNHGELDNAAQFIEGWFSIEIVVVFHFRFINAEYMYVYKYFLSFTNE